MTVTRHYNHPWYGWQSREEEISPTEENVKVHLKKSIGYGKNKINPERLLLDIGKTAYDLEGRFSKIVLNALIKACSEEELKYILSNTRKNQRYEEIEEVGLYWEDLVE